METRNQILPVINGGDAKGGKQTMSQRPIYRKCKKCKNYYSWNPSVGEVQCPHCTNSKIVEGFIKIFKR